MTTTDNFEQTRSIARAVHSSIRMESINWNAAISQEVIPATSDWAKDLEAPEMLVRVSQRSGVNNIAILHCIWPDAGTIPEHYHPNCEEEILVVHGYIDIYVQHPLNPETTLRISLSAGESYTINMGQKHAISAYAGCEYTTTFHPPVIESVNHKQQYHHA